METLAFSDLIIDKTKDGTKLPTNDYQKIGSTAIIDQGQEFIAGYTDRSEGIFTDVPVIIFGDHTRVFKYIDFPFFLGADGVKILKANREVNYRYLYYYFLQAKFPNTGYARHFKWLKELQIPLPPLAEQKHITAILDKTQKIIAEHKQMLQKYDTLIKSRFIEMFGDPVQNPMRWEKTELGNLCKEVRYGTSKPASENGKYTYLRMNNITYEGELDLTNIKSIDISDDELPKCSVKKGDILFNRTNSIELCGKTCLYKLDETMVIAGYIIRVRVNEKLNPQYVSTFFNTKSIKKLLKEMAKGAVNQANINAQEMQSIQIPVPPISLQNEYESFVQQIDKSKFAVQKSLEKTETLYKALMQQYFG